MLCERTGLAIRAEKYEDWQKSDKYHPPTSGFSFCPLCKAEVREEDWVRHCSQICPANPRSFEGASHHSGAS